MMIEVKDEGALKVWIVKRLEDVSDADSDVLADYVLALLKHDLPHAELYKLCIEQLEDFLKDHTPKFVTDTLAAVANKSFLATTSVPPSVSNPTLGFDAPRGPAAGVGFQRHAQNGQGSFSRKRGFNDSNEQDPLENRNGPGARAMKQARRGGFNHPHRGGRPGGPSSSPTASIGFPTVPTPPPGFPPFDPTNPMASILAMQAMGFPSLHGIAAFPHPGVGLPTSLNTIPNGASKSATSINERCKDYDQKGFCALGGTCPYQHGTDHITVPNEPYEYDPNNSAIMMDAPSLMTVSPSANGQPGSDRGHHNSRGRGRGRGRGQRTDNTGQPRHGRAAFSLVGPNQNRAITTIVVEAIPATHFSEAIVRDFFSAFGTITTVQMQALRRLALVTYEDWEGAKRAWESPKAVFDNRFVKVYWHQPELGVPKPRQEGRQKGMSSSTTGEKTAKAEEIDKTGEEKLEKTAEEKEKELEDLKQRQERLQKVHEEKMKKLKETEEARRELEGRRKKLLANQLEETRKLQERLAKKTEALAATTAANATATTTPAIAGETKVSLGDGKGNSSQTEALKAQLAALEAKASLMGIDYALTEETNPFAQRGHGYRGRADRGGGYWSRGRGRGIDVSRRGAAAFRGRGGVAGSSAHKLDNRTKKVSVGGVAFDESKNEALRSYLLGWDYDSIEPDTANAGGTQIIAFKDRFTAEKFLHGTNEIPSVGKVKLEWVNVPPRQSSATVSAPTNTTIASTSATGDDTTMVEVSSRAGTLPTSDTKAALNPHEDYDIAGEEDDDRWIT